MAFRFSTQGDFKGYEYLPFLLKSSGIQRQHVFIPAEKLKSSDAFPDLLFIPGIKKNGKSTQDIVAQALSRAAHVIVLVPRPAEAQEAALKRAGATECKAIPRDIRDAHGLWIYLEEQARKKKPGWK